MGMNVGKSVVVIDVGKNVGASVGGSVGFTRCFGVFVGDFVKNMVGKSVGATMGCSQMSYSLSNRVKQSSTSDCILGEAILQDCRSLSD